MRGICLSAAGLLVFVPVLSVAAAMLPGVSDEARTTPVADEAATEAAAPSPAGETAAAESPAPAAGTATEPAPGPATLSTGAAEPTYPYTGKVTADLVNIRCGPGLYYYPLTTLSKGDDVVVESERDGWLALRPSQDVFGLMRTSDLDIAAGGTSAVVTSPKARVYTSSPTAKRHWCVASILEKGDRVAVLGPDEGDFLRVAPPKDVRVYIVDEYVTASAAGAETPGTGVGAEVVDVEVEAPDVNPLIEAFHKADANLKAEMRKEIGRRDFESSAAEYQAILEKAEKDYIKTACKQRLAYIEAQRDVQEDYLRVDGLAETLDERLAEIQTRRAEKETQRDAEQRMGRADFVAQGMVRRLEILEGVDYPIKYKLVDQNNEPLVVLKSSQYDLSDYVGKVIGVRGTRQYLKDWKVYCVTVDDLEVLE
ncbi:MAG: hypothetical protein R6X20_08305 [Phycisphaerae bacterium]